MNITICSLVECSREAKGLVVIVDVLRSCTTIPILFHQGATEVIPVQTVEDAEKYKSQGYMSVGEIEGGRVHDVFDYNNSPSEVYDKDFSGKRVVFRSNNTSRAILEAGKAWDIILASFVNMGAVVEYIQGHEHGIVTLIPLGRLGTKGVEDELCAQAIQSALENIPFNFDEMRERIAECPTAVLFRDTLQRGAQDVTMALQLNSYPIAPVVVSSEGRKIIKPANSVA